MNIFLLNIITIMIYAIFCKNAYKICRENVVVYQRYNKKHIVGLFVIFCALCMQLGLRGDFAPDTKNYHYIFYSCERFDFLENIYMNEPLFESLNYIIYYLTGSFLIFLFVNAVLTVGSYIYFVYKESNIMWLSLLILICSGNFYSSHNLMRNVLAAALFTLALKYIYEENWKKYIISVLLISMIHTSAIFLLPCYFLPRIQGKRLKPSVVVVAVIVLGAFLFIFTEQIINIVGSFVYSNYLGENAYGMSEGLSLSGMLKGVVYSGGVLINRKYFDRHNKKDMMIYNGCVLHFIITLCSARIFMIQRLCFYFIPFVMLGYPLIIGNIDDLKKRRLILFLVVCMLMLSGINAIISNNYYFFWENKYISW